MFANRLEDTYIQMFFSRFCFRGISTLTFSFFELVQAQKALHPTMQRSEAQYNNPAGSRFRSNCGSRSDIDKRTYFAVSSEATKWASERITIFEMMTKIWVV
jgi:hypothetical protein